MTRRLIHPGRLIKVYEDEARLPDGRTLSLDIVRHPGGAVIVCVNAQREVCLIRQFRHATLKPDTDGWIWELPAGVLEPGEPPQETAKRELIEEAGVQGKDWHDLGVIWSTPGFCDEQLHLFYAAADVIGEAQPEGDEFIEVHWLPLEQAVSQALSGEIPDAKTVIALVRAAAYLDQTA